MTVTASTRRAAYTGNNATTTFAVPFQFFEIAVYVNGVLKTVGTDYAITQSSPGATGSVTFTTAPALAAAVQIIGATVQAQTLDLLDNDSTPAEQYERGLDRLTMIAVETGQVHSQSLRAPPFAAPLPELDFKNNPSSFVNTDTNGVPRLSPIDGAGSPLTPLVAQAAASAASAHTSAVNAETYTQGIATALEQAEQARADAQGAIDDFEKYYLGPLAADPTLDGNGDPVAEGALYFNTVSHVLRVFDGTDWAEAPAGPEGPVGTGTAATITIGNVVTLSPGDPATFVNVGTPEAAVFDIGLPPGDDGAAGTITVGTVTTLTAGSPATVANVGTANAAVLNFGIPAGVNGSGTVSSVNGQSPTSGNVVVNATHLDTTLTASRIAPAGTKISDWLAALDLKSQYYNIATVASAATTDIGVAASDIVLITGTTTITGFGTAANAKRYVRFGGALTLTHNATSLILPGNANIATQAGDIAEFVSDGSGNWRCINYVRANQAPATKDGLLRLNCAADANRDYILGTRNAIGYPVTYFRPATANTRLAFDLTPNGSPSVGTGLVTWLDWCNADVEVTPNLGCARVGVTSEKVVFGSISFGTAPDLPVEMQVGGTAVARWVSNSYLVGKSASSPNTVGCEFSTSGIFYAIADAATPALFNRLTNDGNILTWRRDSTNVGFVSVSSGVVTYGSFSGGHWSQIDNAPNILKGTIMDSLDEMSSWPGEPDQSHLPKCKVSDTEGSKAVYGVFQDYDEDGDAVIVSLGALYVRIGAGVTVARGDLIESAGNGTGRPQTDDVVRSSTVAKVTSATVLTTYADGSYTVPCTLHCG